MKSLFFIFGFIFFTVPLWTQSLLEAHFYADNYRSPGISATYSHHLGQWASNHNGKDIQKRINLGLRIAYHIHPGKHSTYILQPFIRYERIGLKGWFWQPELNLGYLYKENALPTYQVSSEGTVKQVRAGHHRFYPALALGLGYDFRKNSPWPFRVQFRPGLAFEYPNNTGGLFHFQSEFGLAYHFK